MGAVALLAGAWLAWLEGAFLTSWMPNDRVHLIPIFTGIATAGLLAGMVLLRLSKRLAFATIAVSSGLAAFFVLVFIGQIAPVAQGNNDSGEVFWPVALPGLVLAAYGYCAFLKDRGLRKMG